MLITAAGAQRHELGDKPLRRPPTYPHCNNLLERHPRRPPWPAASVRVLALDPRIPESSGLAASVDHPNVLWTHGDSGNPPALFAVDADTGRVARSFPADAANVDWEDIALAPGPQRGRT